MAKKIFEGKRVLVTGGTGSMGKTLVKRLLAGKDGVPEKITVLSRDEAKQHDMRLDFMHLQGSTDEAIYDNFKRTLEFRIGDVRSYDDVLSAMRGCDTVINAAAMKQVPTCEYFPHQAVLTNCIGAENVVRATAEPNMNVETVVGVSTDKAVQPVNVMGMSKSIQERIFIAGNLTSPNTRFVCVRYGNVLASRGSVIPLLHKQIKAGKPVTLTDPNMTRFFISLQEGVDTVFNAVEHAKRGETFVLNAPSTTVDTLAKALIGDRDNKIEVVGIRPGEKMHEIMISTEESARTRKVGNFYGVQAMLPELYEAPSDNENRPLQSEFSSENNIMGLEDTIALLKKHKLMVEDEVDFNQASELLR